MHSGVCSFPIQSVFYFEEPPAEEATRSRIRSSRLLRECIRKSTAPLLFLLLSPSPSGLGFLSPESAVTRSFCTLSRKGRSRGRGMGDDRVKWIVKNILVFRATINNVVSLRILHRSIMRRRKLITKVANLIFPTKIHFFPPLRNWTNIW